jgi:hypothetical protein
VARSHRTATGERAFVYVAPAGGFVVEDVLAPQSLDDVTARDELTPAFDQQNEKSIGCRSSRTGRPWRRSS